MVCSACYNAGRREEAAVPVHLYRYYGFPICYRQEHRKDGDVFVLSYRSRDGTGRILFEDTPRRPPKAHRGDVSAALNVLAPEFLQRCFDKSTQQGVERRMAATLTLGVAWAIDRLLFQKEGGWNRATALRYEIQFQKFLKKCGSWPLAQVTPNACAHTLECLSRKDHEVCVSLLRRIFLQQMICGAICENPWDGYVPSDRRSKKSYHTLLRSNIKEAMLTDAQTRSMVALCFENLERRSNGSLYFAGLLLVLLGLPLKEICALRYQDAAVLEYYPARLVLRITQEYVQPDGCRNYARQGLTDPWQIRTLPVPGLVAEAFWRRRDAMCKRLSDDAERLSNLPLIHTPKNINSAMPAHDLRRWLADHLDPEGKNKSGRKGKSKKAPPPAAAPFAPPIDLVKRMQTTAIRNLDRSGYEEEELRYHLGKHPGLVSAKHYCDFASEAELNKMGCLQDRWANRLWPASTDADQPGGAGRAGEPQRCLAALGSVAEWKVAGLRCGLHLTIPIPAVPPDVLEQHPKLREEGIVLQISAAGGLTALAEFRR